MEKSKATFSRHSLAAPIAPYCLHIKLHTLIYSAVFMFNLVKNMTLSETNGSPLHTDVAVSAQSETMFLAFVFLLANNL